MIAPALDGVGFVMPIEARTFGTTQLKTWDQVGTDLDLMINWVQATN